MHAKLKGPKAAAFTSRFRDENAGYMDAIDARRAPRLARLDAIPAHGS